MAKLGVAVEQATKGADRNMITMGLDLHKTTTTAVLLDEDADELFGPFSTETAEVEQFVRKMPGPVRVVMEAAPHSFILARRLISRNIQVAVVDCHKAKLARRPVHVIFAMLRDRTEFDPRRLAA
ncbi:unnamed protein product [marine sediment metagenome]|uniref:Uncharacterized protein n=1 Tax=marine sediment metagenome TaxID=412755 RepID=X1SE86_9ZZZZ